VTWSVEDDEFVATCAEFPSLSWLADSQPAALEGLVDLVADTVADLAAESEAVPEPLSERSYSGKFNLRVGYCAQVGPVFRCVVSQCSGRR